MATSFVFLHTLIAAFKPIMMTKIIDWLREHDSEEFTMLVIRKGPHNAFIRDPVPTKLDSVQNFNLKVLQFRVCLHPLAGGPAAQYSFLRDSSFLQKLMSRQGNNCLDIYGVIKRIPSRLASSGDSNNNTVPAQSHSWRALSQNGSTYILVVQIAAHSNPWPCPMY